MVDADEFVASGDSGASATYPASAGSLKKGGYVMIKDHPCKIAEISFAKTGKHGSAKAKIVGIDIFTSNKYEEVAPSAHNLDVPNIVRKEYTLIDISDDGYTNLMDEQGNTKEDVMLPSDDVGANIRVMFNEGKQVVVCILNAIGIEKIVSGKEDNS
jgi:translation initiation factor 5A